jgi:hypothetical protein
MKKKKAKTQAGFAAAVETGSSFFALAFVRIKIKSLTSMPDLILVFQLSQRTLMHIRSVARTARVRFLSDKFCYAPFRSQLRGNSEKGVAEQRLEVVLIEG